jgi:MFS family permease
MLVGLALFGVKLLLLTLVNSNNLMLLLPIAVAGGVSTAAYYLAFHALFLDDNDDSRIGEQMGAIQMLGRLAGVVSPFMAGILVDSFGFSVMFIVAIGVLLVSSYPLMIMKHHKKHEGVYSTGHAWDFIRRKPKIAISMFAWSFTDGIQVFYWPILLFILLKSYTSFGIVGSVVMIVNSFSVYLIGKAYDKRQLKATFETSSVLVSVTWAARFLSTTGGTAVVSELFNRIFSPLWWMKIRRQELVEGEKIDSLVFGVAHEYIVTFAYIFALILGYTILLAANGAWGWLALPTIIATLVTAIILKDD